MACYIGFWTLFKKETLRFWKVVFQTIAAPVMTALLYLLIFSHVLSSHVEVYPGVAYTHFLMCEKCCVFKQVILAKAKIMMRG